MSHDITTKLEAKRLFIEEGRSVKEICAQFGLNEKTVYRWRDEEGWEKDRETISLTGVSTLKQSMLLAVRAMEKMVQAGEINARDVDAIMKLIKGAKSLSRDIDKRGNIMLGLSEFVEFMRENHQENLQGLQLFLVEFGNWVKRKYPS